MNENKFQNISKFISDKKLKKINDIIMRISPKDIQRSMDQVEEICNDEGLTTIGTGTNRLVFSTDDSNKIILKVAFDWHGKEANQREYHNRDISKSLVYTYAISPNSVAIIQEKVNNFKSRKEFEGRLKDVRHMLKKLESKILLCDCKLSNYKNFGYRKNGDVCLLDHGDTVPLGNIDFLINAEEDLNVSLRCKKVSKAHGNKMKACGGKLKYDRETYDKFVCSKCHKISTVYEAAKDFLGNDFKPTKRFDDDGIVLSHKLADWIANNQGCFPEIKENKNNKKGDHITMATKIINGETCTQVKGYFYPDRILNDPLYTMKFTSIKLGQRNGSELLRELNLNPNEYKFIPEHKEIKGEKIMNNNAEATTMTPPEKYIQAVKRIMKKIYDIVETNRTTMSYDIMFKDIDDPIYALSTVGRQRVIFNQMKKIKDIGFLTLHEDRIHVSNAKYIKKPDEAESDISSEQLEKIVSEIVDEKENAEAKKTTDEEPKNESTEEEVTIIDNDDSSTEFISENVSIESDDDDDDDDEETEDEKDAEIKTVNDEKCIKTKKYWVPLSLYDYVTDENGNVMKKRDIQKILSQHNRNPKKYRVKKEDETNTVTFEDQKIIIGDEESNNVNDDSDNENTENFPNEEINTIVETLDEDEDEEDDDDTAKNDSEEDETEDEDEDEEETEDEDEDEDDEDENEDDAEEEVDSDVPPKGFSDEDLCKISNLLTDVEVYGIQKVYNGRIVKILNEISQVGGDNAKMYSNIFLSGIYKDIVNKLTELCNKVENGEFTDMADYEATLKAEIKKIINTYEKAFVDLLVPKIGMSTINYMLPDDLRQPFNDIVDRRNLHFAYSVSVNGRLYLMSSDTIINNSGDNVKVSELEPSNYAAYYVTNLTCIPIQ